MRRFSGLGTLGTGGIYKVDMTDPNTAYTGASAYVDLRAIGIDTGNDVRIAADSCNNLAITPWSPSRDVAAWDKVGKVGVGDIDYDEPNNRLWLVNLNDRKLYGIANVTPSTTPTAANVLGGYAVNLPSPYTCTSGTFRPWAVKYHRGYVYVGGVCDAASDPYNLSKVRGYVLRFNPANTAAGFTHVKDFALNQPRSGYGYTNTGEWSGWLPQADAVNVRPQFHSPIVSNLEFDTDGSIIVGIIDRAGLQKGTNSYDEPACDDPTVDYVDTMGDVLRLCKTDTGYLSDSEPGCSTAIASNSKTTDEYYWGDLGPSNNAWEGMNEIAAGGLALAPGKEHVLASAYDANSWGSNGVVWLNNRTGAKDNSYHVSATTLGKSTGMGELEVLCNPAPIEVGNRVWLDADKDGIQDSGEAGINNVAVALTCGTDTSTTTTNAIGEYYFSNTVGGNASFMGSGESCSLKINNAQTSLNGLSLTTQNTDSKTDNNAQTDIRDSDATSAVGTASISFTVGSSGQNNHSLDFGYKSPSSPGTVSGTVYLDANKNASFDSGTETGIPNIALSLYDENATASNLSDDTLVNTTSTNTSGAYSFTNVDSSRTYRVAADTTDPDLPANTSSSTANPLTTITVTAGGTTANKNFGFAQIVAACSPPATTTTGANASVTWNHNPYTPASQISGGHPVPAIFNTGLINSAANEVRSNITTGATDWEMYAETASVPATLTEAINSSKYFGYSFTTQSSLSNSHILYGLAMSTLGPNNTWNHSGKYKVHVRIDDNAAFASPTVVKNLIQIDEDNPTTGGDVSEGPLYGSDFYISHYNFDTPATLEANKTYYLRFYVYDDAKAGVANSVAGRIIFDDLLLKTLDCGAAPTTLMSVSDAVVTEGNSGLSYLKFPVQLSNAAPAGGVSFNYTTTDDTATLANNDYQATSGTLTIPMGASGSVISVPVVGDTTIEPNEKIRLTISNVVNAQYINGTYPEPPQGSIIDDDTAVACNASSGHFGGIVFQDYNQNGSRDGGETGLSGIIVTAYNSSNTAAATATTDATGWYKLTGLTTGAQYRLEFTNLPVGIELGVSGTNTSSNVQLVTVSATCDANLGVYNPVDYCQADPKLLTARYINGDTSASGANMTGSFAALLSFNYSASGIAPPTLNQDALGSQVGSIWGLAYNRHNKKAFASAMVRRHVGLGPLGIGGLYVINYSGASPVVSNFLNLDGLAGIDVGSIGNNSARNLPGDPYLPNHDPTAFDKVGKEGLGDIELSDDGNTLYVSNLYSRKIIKIDLTAYNTSGTVPTTATELSQPAVSCNNGVARPFGMKYYRGKLYAGITCTGENGGSSADLKASIQAFDGTSWAEKLQVPLNYPRWHADHMRAAEYSRYNIPWVSSLSALTLGDHGSADYADDAQLMLSGIEFDTNGDMLLGFIDRTGLQFGQYNYGTDTSSTRFYGVFSNGELLKASYNATTGVYTVENAGTANGIAGEGVKTGTNPAWPYGGIGGGEFYGGEKFVGHTENAFGALALVPGKQEVALNAMNPFNITTGGTIWLNNQTGTRTSGVQLYGEDNRFLGKAVGLGDLEVLCDPAPTEIGNRVWLDSDNDGLQDAGEAGINNVTVTLACGTDTASVTTNAQGEYYFSNKTGGNATFMGSGESCSLSVNNTQASVSAYTLTTQNADSKTDNNSKTDIRDSDAATSSGNAVISFTVGAAGQNNHSLDIGYTTTTAASCDGGTLHLINSNGDIDAILPNGTSVNVGFAGTHVSAENVAIAGYNDTMLIFHDDGNVDAIDVAGNNVTNELTNLSGFSEYQGVGFDNTANKLILLDSNGKIRAFDSNGVLDATHPFNGRAISADYVDIAYNNTNNTLLIFHDNGDIDAIDSNGNPAVTPYDNTDAIRELSEYQGIALGLCGAATNIISGTVYTDSNGNNNYDSGTESGIGSITVSLYNDKGTPTNPADDVLMASTSSAASGFYSFDSVNVSLSYRLEVDTADTNLPSGASIGTTNPLASVTVTAGAITANQNFGFDINTLTGACVTQGGTLGTTNYFTELDNGTMGVGSGAADESPATNPYPGKISNGTYDHYYSMLWGEYSFVSNAQTKRNSSQHANLVDPVYGATGRFFASDPNNQAPIISTTLSGLNPGKSYQVGFYVANSEPSTSSPNNEISILIDGIEVYTTGELLPATPMQWEYHTFVYHSGNATSLGFGLRANNVGDGGNDYLLDNITVQECENVSGSISGKVYTDTNGNDSFDAGTETGIASITVTLLNAANNSSVATTSTAADGSYSFASVNPALTYKIQVDTADTDLPAGSAIGTINPLTNKTVTAGSTLANQNFGFDLVSKNSISGKIFEDINYGGGAGRPLSTPGIAGILGVRVELYNSTGAFVTSTTSIDGGPYSFSNVASGNYYVRVVNDTIRSTRAGSTAAERAIQTHRTNGTADTNNEVGGRNPALVDSGANTTNQTLNTTTFKLSGGGQAQSVQPVTVAGSTISGVQLRL
ncbi:MAG: hypothetical protein BWK73_36945 [Thiothrix lacustris]|uniref:Calx-beta domain-containing protein n=1 Tax=Thiothrix lacustris TaxID=525917 RepID=A0A1Y1QF41_9GAMM|nr:MAG: hypothetical protein BWK73_36945 [Thiothrix lacustris]